jgi:hypothetical protein
MITQNRICRPLSATTEAPVTTRTLAELLRDLGVVLSRRMRHQVRMDDVSLHPQSLRWESNLALGFVNLRPSVQLRAMVEDWPLYRIQEAIHKQQFGTVQPHEGYPRRIGPQRGAEQKNKRAGLRGARLLIWLAACGFAAGLAAGIIGGLR